MPNPSANQTDNLGSGSIPKLLFKLALPAIAAQIINLLYNLVDRMYIGHIDVIGDLALTGMGVCLPLIMLISAFAALVSMGSAPRASIFLGKGDKASAEKTLGNSFTLLVIISLILTAVFLIFSEDMLMIFGASPQTIGYAVEYMQIYSIGTLFVQLTLGLNAFISAQGFAKTSMMTVLIGAISNIILDPIFIFTFKMGVSGAALATIISQAISMVWILVFLSGKKTTIRIKKENLALDPKIFLPCLALGLAPFIMQSTESLLTVCFNSSLLGYGGNTAVGAMTILSSVMQLSMLPLFGLSQGAQPIMSYNYGAGNPKRVKKTFKLLLISSLSYSTLLWALAMLFPKMFILIFNNNPVLVEFTVKAMRIYMSMALIFGIQIACQQSFIAMGDAKSSLAAALMRKIIILIPMIYIMPALGIFSDKTTAVFAAEPVSDTMAVTFTAILFSVRFKKSMAALECGSVISHKQSRFYRSLRWVLHWATPKMKTIWQQPYEGEPAVFVCNHDRAYGPIAMCVHFSHRDNIRPWINAQVLSHRAMPEYVRHDFWWDPDKWNAPLCSYTLAYFYALIIPPILRGSDCIPVYHSGGVMSTLRSSVKYLKDGYQLLLFPEHPSGYCQYTEELFDGYTAVAKLLHKRTGQCLRFYPTYVNWKEHTISVSSPITYDPQLPLQEQTDAVNSAVKSFFAENRQN